jgi:transposase
MAVRKEIEKEYAKLLFIKHGLNQKQVAERVKVTEKTLAKWIVDGKWNDQKRSLMSTRTNIIRELENQIELWKEAIAEREDKLVSPKEADMLIKLVSGIKKFETEIGVGEIVTTMMELISFIQPIDFEFSKRLSGYADAYIKSKIK